MKNTLRVVTFKSRQLKKYLLCGGHFAVCLRRIKISGRAGRQWNSHVKASPTAACHFL